ncbi:MAG: LCP family protein [Clostridia bacterium]|nr:LCP family protein [Clostridia bacterium]
MNFFKKNINIILSVLVLIICALTWYVWDSSKTTEPVSEDYVWNSTLETEYIEYNGRKYIQNPDIETILIGGVDKDGKIDMSTPNESGGHADMLFLVVINSRTKTVDKIQINRDTMTEIDVLDDNFSVKGTAIAQIALAHAYGNGGSVSCHNTVKAVENLLFGIEINKYMFLNMGAIPKINDFFGGIEVLVEDSFAGIDDTLVRGRRIKLTGKQAYNFLRSRKGLEDASNVNRMKRHRQYVDNMIDTIKDSVEKEEISVFDLYNEIYDYMATSLSASEITSLVVKTKDYTDNNIIVPKGEFNEENEFMEFYTDDEALRRLVMDLFYVEYEE